MEKSQNKKFSKISWLVFIFTISIVMISLVPAIFPALFSNTFFNSELDTFEVPSNYGIDSFEIGGLALPLIISNIVILTFFFFFKKKGFQKKLDRVVKYQISQRIAIITIIIILAGYVSVSYSEIGIGLPIGQNDELYGDWDRLKHKLANMENIWPQQITAEPHFKHTLLKISGIIFGNYFVIPFLSSIGLLIVTYLFTNKITDSRLAGLLALLLVLQSNLFLAFDTSAAFSSFWILFYQNLYLL